MNFQWHDGRYVAEPLVIPHLNEQTSWNRSLHHDNGCLTTLWPDSGGCRGGWEDATKAKRREISPSSARLSSHFHKRCLQRLFSLELISTKVFNLRFYSYVLSDTKRGCCTPPSHMCWAAWGQSGCLLSASIAQILMMGLLLTAVSRGGGLL